MRFESPCQKSPVVKPSRVPLNLYETFSKFAKVCKLRSIRVFGSGNQKTDNLEKVVEVEEINGNGSVEKKCDGKKDYSQPINVQISRNVCDHIAVLKLFDTLSVLKMAYVRLQEAHIPYDPDKISGANDIVVAQLESLLEIKQAYKEKKLKEMNSSSASSALLEAEIQVKEKLLENMKSKVKDKEAQVLRLRQELEEVKGNCKMLAEKAHTLDKQSVDLFNFCSVEQVVRKVENAIHDFAKPLIALMKVSGWDLEGAVNCIESSVVYAKRSHRKYAFEAYIARRMFHGFSFQSQDMDRIVNLDDPMNAIIEDPQSSFANFCRMKYLLVVHAKMEASFFGNLDNRRFVANGLHPQTPFFRAFVKMARWVWILQGTCPSNIHNADMFTVKRGSKFSDTYMNPIDELKGSTFMSAPGEGRHRVEFMILPGFQIGFNTIKSRVYISKFASSLSPTRPGCHAAD